MTMAEWEAYLWEIENRGYIVSPLGLVNKAINLPNFKFGVAFNKLEDYLEKAVDVVEEWTNMWEKGHGFGSSDYTALLREYIEECGSTTAFDENGFLIVKA